MDFEREWTIFSIDAEIDSFGPGRLVKAHNQKIAELKKYLKHARDNKKIRLGEIEGLEAKIVELREALQSAFAAIESLPIDALGSVPDTATDQGWPIRDELLNKLHYAPK